MVMRSHDVDCSCPTISTSAGPETPNDPESSTPRRSASSCYVEEEEQAEEEDTAAAAAVPAAQDASGRAASGVGWDERD
jgi:hypothetical protein